MKICRAGFSKRLIARRIAINKPYYHLFGIVQVFILLSICQRAKESERHV